MTTEQIHVALEMSKGFPIRVVCDNMLIFMSNNTAYAAHNEIQEPDCIWVDDKEYMISIRPSTQYERSQLPVEISVVPYDMIQYIQAYVPIKETLKDVDSLKAHISKDQIKIINDMLSRIAPQRVYVPEANDKSKDDKS